MSIIITRELMMVEWISILAVGFLAFVVEKYFTSRPAVIVNCCIILATFGWGVLMFLDDGLMLWAFFSIFAAAIAFLSYTGSGPLPQAKFLYPIFFIFYSSKTVLGVLIAVKLNALEWVILFVGIIWVLAIFVFHHKLPFLEQE